MGTLSLTVRYGDRPLLIVYDLETHKRRKLLRCAEFKSQEVVSLAFSHDSKYLLAQVTVRSQESAVRSQEME